ncbi:hypothetical protein [Tahibacter caeni]|uniref:hypothetical protein n=1 Tax=Tahibacter caeni TaxID=1453545 RepID=UPI002148107C|nr:hypothetical protein [Tahibacter caeni]
MNTSVESPTGGQRSPRPRKTGDTVKIALISAVTAVITALITAGVTVYQATLAAEKAASEAKASAEHAKESEQGASRAARVAEALNDGKCPSAVTKDGVPLLKTFTDNYEGTAGSARELLNIQGHGCLISGSVLGYYVQNTAGGRNYTISINVDGYEFTYPMNTDGKTAAYAQDAAENNTGVLVLPQIAFRNSLRITYYYAGGGKEIAAHALVAYQTD